MTDIDTSGCRGITERVTLGLRFGRWAKTYLIKDAGRTLDQVRSLRVVGKLGRPVVDLVRSAFATDDQVAEGHIIRCSRLSGRLTDLYSA